MTILRYIFIGLEVVLLFNLLIGVHELGHFLAAKWRGLKVDRFAIWFGKPIWKKKINGVEYALGWIPAGGYVALPQMATMEAIEGKPDEAAAEPLPNVSPADGRFQESYHPDATPPSMPDRSGQPSRWS